MGDGAATKIELRRAGHRAAAWHATATRSWIDWRRRTSLASGCSHARSRRTGAQLLAYRTAHGWAELHADDVNAYLKQHTGGAFTAKDFRTWNATVLAAVVLATLADAHSRRAARERNVRHAIKTVAAYLGNTPAVCRASYVDPRVIDRYHAGVTIAHSLGSTPADGPDLADARVRRRIETALLELLAETPA